MTIALTHYRNYHNQRIPLGQHTVLTGPNGVGKTNVLEAIRTISVARSYRVDHDRDTIEWGQNYCRVVWEDSPKVEYIVTLEPIGAKKVMKLGGAPTSLADVYGAVPTVLFSPETMELITGAPQERRRFLDTLLSQASRVYLDNLLTYRKAMRERHFVLLRLGQGLGSTDELVFWDSVLVRCGAYVMAGRFELVQKLNATLATSYPWFLVDQSETVEIKYEQTVTPEQFPNKLKSSQAWDIKNGTTRYGPHRDELRFILNGRDVMLFASRGEIRSVVLATKLAEAHYLAERQKDEQKPNVPILLLDDVFSELDASRRSPFLELIAPYRSVVTTTSESFGAKSLPNTLVHRLPFEKPAATPKPKRNPIKKASRRAGQQIS